MSQSKKYEFTPVPGANYRLNYAAICDKLNSCVELGDTVSEYSYIRALVLDDLFFLIYFVLGVQKINHPWLVDRVSEVQERHQNTLDLWAREHFKSTILTFALPIWEALRNPEERICIISHTRSIAKAFLQRIKVTLETNEMLIRAFPDTLWMNPEKESPKWSLDMGLVLRRKGNFLESTFEAWGIIDGMPAGKHFTGRIYDDLVTETTVSTPDQISKTQYAYELSHNIGARGGWFRVIGTIYHFADLYMHLQKEGLLHVRKYPCRVNGEGVFFTDAELNDKRGHTGPYVWACQMMLDPVADENQIFNINWLRHYRDLTHRLNYYIMVDPASKKKQNADFTTMWVVGVDSAKNFYIVDGVHDRLSMKEKWEHLRELKFRWNPMGIGYEEYAMQSDIEFIRDQQERDGVYFAVTPLGGHMKKEDRIKRLVPYFESGRVIFPKRLLYRRSTGETVDLTEVFTKDEFLTFPYSAHDDMLDCLARILDENMKICYPSTGRMSRKNFVNFNPLAETSSGGTWLSA